MSVPWHAHTNTRSPETEWPADGPVQAIEEALQALANRGATADQVSEAFTRFSSDNTGLSAAVQASLAQRQPYIGADA